VNSDSFLKKDKKDKKKKEVKIEQIIEENKVVKDLI